MQKLVALIVRIQDALGVCFFVGLTVVLTLQVFSRFIFHSPFMWSEEVASFLFFWVALIGAAASLRTRRHFVIDLFQPAEVGDHHQSEGLFLRFINLLRDAIIFAFCILMIWLGIQYTLGGLYRTGSNSHVNFVFVYAAIPVAFVAMALYASSHLLDSWRVFKDGDSIRRGGSQ